MSEVLIRGYKAKEQIEEIIEAAKYGSNNCMIGSGLEIIELPEHGDLIDRVAFRAEMDNHYPFGRGTQRRHGEADAAKSTIINMLATAPVVVPASEEAPDD